MEEKNKKPIRAKKSLGQNFLKSVLALNKIISAGQVKEGDLILEIGPGKGALTEKLLATGARVVAVEKDLDLIDYLRERFHSAIGYGKLTVINKDILDFDTQIEFKNTQKYKIIANIPYNITGAILKKFLTQEHQPETMVLMVQHEVAQRIVGKDEETLLSISVKAYGRPSIVLKVPKRYFSPQPKVDSAILLIEKISKNIFAGEEGVAEEIFWELVRAGFSHRRKVLIGNLKNYRKKINWVDIFKKLGIKETARAEDISLDGWIKILKEIK